MKLAPKLYCARWLVIQANVLISICGFVLLALGIWTVNDKLFLDELLRNKLYTDTAYIIIVISNLIIILSCFGCFAAVKEVKCLLLTYAVFMMLLLVILAVAGVLSYIFRDQVVNTIQAEMIADIRNYDPGNPSNSVTRAWDLTQSQLGCCGLVTETYPQSWEQWRANKYLNPSSNYQVVPNSCCVTGLECVSIDNKTIVQNIWPGDCMVLSLKYVQDHALTLGIANVTVCCFLFIGLLSALSLFRSIV